ncbi:site-specific recombinase XerD [Kribbella voronezhensis]|uniref:Site-specific recombinase XerD n=1 Tax=Kribbella voronezhensis TaxID=2512212 RepID=A0A4R7TBS3_9ACTN|nr:site-specific integrase [Kribbella voronezhensis]TDU89445.1 site-specific recombinase XerD [Kribbella voronezhensis]
MSEEDDKRHKNPDGRSSIYFGSDGYWHGRVTMGVKDDGTPNRPHVKRRRKEDVVARVQELEKERDSGKVRRTEKKKWTVAEWLTHWLTIARPGLRDGSYDAYEVAVRVHLIPGLGAHKLNRLQPEHLERFYTKMQDNGSSAGTAHQAHRTIRTALGEAEKRGALTADNPAEKANPPRLDLDEDDEIDPYTVEEIQAILVEAGKRRNNVRWAIALALGLRQGEALGLKWSDIDLEKGVLKVRRSLNRPKYKHGCDEPCGRKPGHCPGKQLARSQTSPTKSRAGRRTIGLPSELTEILQAHWKAQAAERVTARQLWKDEGWVFAKRTGQALSPNMDYREWKDILAKAGIREGRLHDARHAAATVLLLLGVPDRAVMDVMGWSSSSMVKRYQHVTAVVRMDIAERVGGLIWAKPETKAGKKSKGKKRKKGRRDDGPAGVSVPA